MGVQTLTISEVVLQKFDVGTRQCTVHIHFVSHSPVSYSFVLSQDFATIVSSLIGAVKRGKQDVVDSFSDDPLAGYNPVHILNRDDFEERFAKGLAQLFGDVRGFSRMNDAHGYINARATLQDSKRVLFSAR